MKIYTKTGDNGTTALFGGRRLPKSDPQVVAYGSVDELTSFIGLLLAKITSESDKKFLTDIQKDLYIIMSSLSGASIHSSVLKEKVIQLEKKIDEIELKLPKLIRFILPQGSETTALSHIARTVCRRAEREVVKVKSLPLILQYLNRLSDFLFVLARSYNKKEITANI